MADHVAQRAGRTAARRAASPLGSGHGPGYGIGQRVQDGVPLGVGQEREDALAARAGVELAPLAQRAPDVADGMGRFDRVDGPELAPRGRVQREDQRLVELAAARSMIGRATRADIQPLGEQHAQARQRRADPESAGAPAAAASSSRRAISWSMRWTALRGRPVCAARSRTPHSSRRAERLEHGSPARHGRRCGQRAGVASDGLAEVSAIAATSTQ